MINKMVKPLERAFYQSASFQTGVVPVENDQADVNRLLKDVDPDEARKMRRKFRKLWRTAARKSGSHWKQVTDFKEEKGGPTEKKKQKRPRRSALLRRKELVRAYMYKKHVMPMLEKAEKIERENPKE